MSLIICVVTADGLETVAGILIQFNSLRPRRNRRHFADAIFKWIFLNENVSILIRLSLKFVPKAPINNIPVLVQIMAWRRPGDKPSSEPMMVSLPTHICVTRPQWVKGLILTLVWEIGIPNCGDSSYKTVGHYQWWWPWRHDLDLRYPECYRSGADSECSEI